MGCLYGTGKPETWQGFCDLSGDALLTSLPQVLDPPSPDGSTLVGPPARVTSLDEFRIVVFTPPPGCP